MPSDAGLDESHLEALADTELHSFHASPADLAPFDSTVISWKVSAPLSVSIYLDAQKVAHSGSTIRSPDATEAHRLSARSGQYSKVLGTLTIHMNLAVCTGRSDTSLTSILAAKISDEIEADQSGLSFRLMPVRTQSGITYIRSKPDVRITPGFLSIDLKLKQEEDWFPNADVDISVRFGLAIGKDPVSIIGSRRIVATDIDISVSISFPFYAYLVPGALPGLYIAIDGGKEKARKRMLDMIARIVGASNAPGAHERNLNNYFAFPRGYEPHDVRLEVDSYDVGTFSVVYCPRMRPGIVGSSGSAGVG